MILCYLKYILSLRFRDAVPFGYIGILWFEELDQFDGPEQIRNVEQSALRGGPFSMTFKSFNPPAMARNWANKYAREEKSGKLVHHSTYLTTPPEWLGPRFLEDAEHLKEKSYTSYRHTEKKDPQLETQVEAVLDQHGIFYDKTETWIESETKEDTVQPGTEKLSITADPRGDGLVKARTGDTTDNATYNGWYSAVYTSTGGSTT